MVPDRSFLLIDAFPVVRHRTLHVWRSKWACEAWISPSAGRHTALPADEPVSSVWSASGLCFGCKFVNDDTSAADSLAIASSHFDLIIFFSSYIISFQQPVATPTASAFRPVANGQVYPGHNHVSYSITFSNLPLRFVHT